MLCALAVAEVVKILERFRADIFDCRQQRDLARIERAISPVLISQTKGDVADTELVKVAVGPAPSPPAAPREDDGA